MIDRLEVELPSGALVGLDVELNVLKAPEEEVSFVRALVAVMGQAPKAEALLALPAGDTAEEEEEEEEEEPSKPTPPPRKRRGRGTRDIQCPRCSKVCGSDAGLAAHLRKHDREGAAPATPQTSRPQPAGPASGRTQDLPEGARPKAPSFPSGGPIARTAVPVREADDVHHVVRHGSGPIGG